MPRHHRLTRESIAALVSGRSKRVNGTFFTVMYSPVAADVPRVACVVSKKIAAHAVDRNRLKRRFREIMRESLASLPPYTMMWYARKGAQKASFEDLSTEIKVLIPKI